MATSGASITAQGTLAFNVTSLSLSATANGDTVTSADTFVITNSGAGGFAGTSVSDDAAWLTLTRTEYTDGRIELTPVVNPTGVAAGSYTGTITVTDPNASNTGATLTVDLVVGAESPTIAAFPSQLAFTLTDETAGTAATTTISNVGSGTLATPTVGIITYSGAFTGWVSATQVTDNGDGTFTVSVTPTAVGGTVGGPYTASIPIASGGATNTPLTLTATLTVTASALAVISLDRVLDDAGGTVGGANPPAQTVGIRSANATALAGPTVQSTAYRGDHSGWATATISGSTLTVAIDTSGIATAGISYADIVIADVNAATTDTYTVYLKMDQVVAPAVLSVTPGTVSLNVVNGTSPSNVTLTLVNSGSGGLAGLGTVTASFASPPSWCTATYANGVVTLAFSTAALANATYSSSLTIAASSATNTPVTVPVSVIVAAASAATYPPGPQVAASPAGWTYNQSVGYWEGSCFNDGGYAGAADGAMPTFAGTEHIVTNSSQLTTALATAVDGDIITITAGGTYANVQVPVRSGWTEGTSGFVWVRSSGYASLPAYQPSRGPNVFTAANRATDADLANMVTFSSASQTLSTLCLQQGTGGWWFTGIHFKNTYTSPTYLPSIVVNTSGHVGTNPSMSTLAQMPSHIVFDRCLVRSTTNPTRAVFCGARYSVWQQCSLPDTYNNNTEPQAFLFLNGGERTDILGCSFSGFGEHIMGGGGNPPIKDYIATDVMVAWNYAWIDVATRGSVSDDNKNAFELKSGGRFCFAFNKIDGQSFKADQKFALLTKGTDQTEIQNGVKVQNPLFPAHTYDIIFWCNDLSENVKKGFFQLADESSDVASSMAIGTERVEVAWNKHYYDVTVPSTYNPGRSERQAMALYRAQGDGSPNVWVYHNTFGGGQSMWTGDPTNVGGTGWANLRVFNNVLNEPPQYGPFFGGSSGSNSTGLNNNFGAGVWDCRRNIVLAGGAAWDTTLLTAPYQCGPTHSSNAASVFQSV
ncbi:MAG: autotransporter outer membrane beta-barrel domain-containing protein, partial [Gemmatimonadaceae bacterium]